MSKILDEQMSEVADFFAGRIVGDSDVLYPKALDRTALNCSLESLRSVDTWMAVLHQAGIGTQSQGAAETIIWAGAYVGEVIRRNSSRGFTWERYEDFMATQPESTRSLIPETFGTQFILVAKSGGCTFPINKVCRWLDEGNSNNLHYYASGEINRS